ncbi:MAG: tryptophan synthase subunit beta [Cyanobacteria bacterium P01_H01_bin.74]
MKSQGFFGEYGGIYVSELLMPALEAVESAFLHYKSDPAFLAQFHQLLKDFAGRPTPLFEAKNLSNAWGNARIFLKREDLLHGGAHKTNNAIGQVLLAKAMGKSRIIAETGAGQHGVATAMAGALLGVETIVYMGATDVERQQPNVQRMRLLGATVKAVTSGSGTLKDAINDALRDWIANVRETYYVMGTVAGPHPYPTLVKFFHQVIGQESFQQMQDQVGVQPDVVMACVGGGSNAIGIFSSYADVKTSDGNPVKLIGVEPAGHGLDTDKHGAVLAKGTLGCLHGMKSLALQDADGQVFETHSISAGLDYPLVGPEHAWLQSVGKAQYVAATDDEAIDAFETMARLEGILPALETAHAIAHIKKLSPTMPKGSIILLNLSGRGDKDLNQVLAYQQEQNQTKHPGDPEHQHYLNPAMS